MAAPRSDPPLPGLAGTRRRSASWARKAVDRALRARIAAGSLDEDLDADLIVAARALADVVDDERAAHRADPDRSRFVQTTATRALAAVAAQLRAGAPPTTAHDDLDDALDDALDDPALRDAAQP